MTPPNPNSLPVRGQSEMLKSRPEIGSTRGAAMMCSGHDRELTHDNN